MAQKVRTISDPVPSSMQGSTYMAGRTARLGVGASLHAVASAGVGRVWMASRGVAAAVLIVMAATGVVGCGGGARQSRIDYPSRFALLTKLEGRLGTLRQMLPGRQRSFAPDLELAELVGLPTTHLRSHLGPPMDCGELSVARRRLICRDGEWVYRFFVGDNVREETYLIIDADGTRHIKRATWRVVRKRSRSPRTAWWLRQRV